MTSMVAERGPARCNTLPENFGPFHDPYLAATYFPLCVHLVIATICTSDHCVCRSRKYAAGYLDGSSLGWDQISERR
jgi:hypothetical protein